MGTIGLVDYRDPNNKKKNLAKTIVDYAWYLINCPQPQDPALIILST